MFLWVYVTWFQSAPPLNVTFALKVRTQVTSEECLCQIGGIIWSTLWLCITGLINQVIDCCVILIGGRAYELYSWIRLHQSEAGSLYTLAECLDVASQWQYDTRSYPPTVTVPVGIGRSGPVQLNGCWRSWAYMRRIIHGCRADGQSGWQRTGCGCLLIKLGVSWVITWGGSRARVVTAVEEGSGKRLQPMGPVSYGRSDRVILANIDGT